MKNKLKLLFWLCLGASATAVLVPLIAALDTTRPLMLITENSAWIALVVLGAVSVIALIAMRDKERTDGDQGGQHRIEAQLTHADPVSRVLLTSPWSADYRRYSLSFICGAALAAGLIPFEVLSGDRLPDRIPTRAARSVVVSEPTSDGGSRDSLMLMIDADRNGIQVVFDHLGHQQNYGRLDSCGRCHHANKGVDRATPCFECHADFILPTDVFSHEAHIRALDHQASCERCHVDPAAPKARATATPCGDCHAGLRPRQQHSLEKEATDFAPGYAHSLHASCTGCHAQEGLLSVDSNGLPKDCSPCHPESQHDRLEKSETWEILKAIQILTPRDGQGEQ